MMPTTLLQHPISLTQLQKHTFAMCATHASSPVADDAMAGKQTQGITFTSGNVTRPRVAVLYTRLALIVNALRAIVVNEGIKTLHAVT
jgi:hypothetical protein